MHVISIKTQCYYNHVFLPLMNNLNKIHTFDNVMQSSCSFSCIITHAFEKIDSQNLIKLYLSTSTNFIETVLVFNKASINVP